MNMATRIESAMRAENLNQTQLAELLSVTPQAVQQWINGKTSPKGNRLIALAKALKVSAEWLLTGSPAAVLHKPINQENINSNETREIGIYSNTAGAPSTSKKVPLISWVSAGLWCDAINNYPPGDAEYWLPCPIKCGHNTFALRVNGDSMTSMIPGAKTYPSGCIIYVDPGVQVTNGSRVVATLTDNNDVTFKTYREDAGQKWLMPINPQYDKILIDKNVMICGVVIAKYEPE